MATQSNCIQQRTRTKAAPSFPRERQPQQPQQQPQQQQQQVFTQQQQLPPNHPLFLSSTPHPYFANNTPQLSDLDGWRLPPLHSAPLSGPSRRSSRGPRAPSPARSVIDAQRVFTWDQTNHFQTQQRQHFRRKSITSNTSSSDHRLRSPSPGTPRTNSKQLRASNDKRYNSNNNNNRKMTGQSNAGGGNPGCSFETALVNSRRRIPYSVGSESLAVVPLGSYHARLDEKDERCLSVDIMDLYHVTFLLIFG